MTWVFQAEKNPLNWESLKSFPLFSFHKENPLFPLFTLKSFLQNIATFFPKWYPVDFLLDSYQSLTIISADVIIQIFYFVKSLFCDNLM